MSKLDSVIQSKLMESISTCTTLRERVNSLWALGLRNQAGIARLLSANGYPVTKERVRQLLGDKMQEYKDTQVRIGAKVDPQDGPLTRKLSLRLSEAQMQSFETAATKRAEKAQRTQRTQRTQTATGAGIGVSTRLGASQWVRSIADVAAKIQALEVDPLELLWQALEKVADERTAAGDLPCPYAA